MKSVLGVVFVVVTMACHERRPQMSAGTSAPSALPTIPARQPNACRPGMGRPEADLPTFGVHDALARAATLAERRVRVCGFLHVEYESSALFDTELEYERGWDRPEALLPIAWQPSASDVQRACERKRVCVEGTMWGPHPGWMPRLPQIVDVTSIVAEGVPWEAPAPAGSRASFDAASAIEAMQNVSIQSCRTFDGPVGEGVVRVVFDPDGACVSAVVESGPLVATSVGGCVAGRFRAVRVPPFAPPSEVVRMPFHLQGR